jgi:hypothetical protein
MITISQAIKSLDSTAEFSIKHGDTDVITWITTPINDTDIATEQARLQAIYDNNQYQRDRQYAPTGDQLDMLWHSIDAGEFGDTAKQSEFYTANKAVKDAFPKG